MKTGLINRLKALEEVTKKGASVSIVNEENNMTDAEIAAEVKRINVEERAKGFDPLIIIMDWPDDIPRPNGKADIQN